MKAMHFHFQKIMLLLKELQQVGINNSAVLWHQGPLMAPQGSRKIFVTIHVAMQQHEETNCALEKLVIPLGEEEKEDNLIFKSKGGAHTHEK